MSKHRRILVWAIFIVWTFAVLLLGLSITFGWGAWPARADHGGATFEHECPLPDGDPRGWPCTHTMPNGQKYIDWSYAYIDDRNYPPVGEP